MPHRYRIFVQIGVAILGIVLGAEIFVKEVQVLSETLGAAPLVVSLLITPIATELPEKFNSVLWIRQRKDTLALGNITGAMVFQSTFPVSVGLIFTTWQLTTTGLVSGVLALVSGTVFYVTLRIRHSAHVVVAGRGRVACTSPTWCTCSASPGRRAGRPSRPRPPAARDCRAYLAMTRTHRRAAGHLGAGVRHHLDHRAGRLAGAALLLDDDAESGRVELVGGRRGVHAVHVGDGHRRCRGARRRGRRRRAARHDDVHGGPLGHLDAGDRVLADDLAAGHRACSAPA